MFNDENGAEATNDKGFSELLYDKLLKKRNENDNLKDAILKNDLEKTRCIVEALATLGAKIEDSMFISKPSEASKQFDSDFPYKVIGFISKNRSPEFAHAILPHIDSMPCDMKAYDLAKENVEYPTLPDIILDYTISTNFRKKVSYIRNNDSSKFHIAVRGNFIPHDMILRDEKDKYQQYHLVYVTDLLTKGENTLTLDKYGNIPLCEISPINITHEGHKYTYEPIEVFKAIFTKTLSDLLQHPENKAAENAFKICLDRCHYWDVLCEILLEWQVNQLLNEKLEIVFKLFQTRKNDLLTSFKNLIDKIENPDEKLTKAEDWYKKKTLFMHIIQTDQNPISRFFNSLKDEKSPTDRAKELNKFITELRKTISLSKKDTECKSTTSSSTTEEQKSLIKSDENTVGTDDDDFKFRGLNNFEG